MASRLEGKVAIITGAGGGIGRGIAHAFAREGARVIVNDVNGDSVRALTEEIRAEGKETLAIEVDVTDNDQVEAMMRKVLDTFGRIDVLVNNAGVPGEHTGPPLSNITEEDWDMTYKVNLKAIFLTCKAVMPHMIKQKSGKIINISSIAGKTGKPSMPHYSASKAGAISFTQSLAMELAPHHINVNAICPGIIWTPLWEKLATSIAESDPNRRGMEAKAVFEDIVKRLMPMKTEQTAEDIAMTAVFLASNESDQITGQAINVDGGMELH